MTHFINEAVPTSVARQLEWMLVNVTEESERLKRALISIASDGASNLTAIRACALLALEPGIGAPPSFITGPDHNPDNTSMAQAEVESYGRQNDIDS